MIFKVVFKGIRFGAQYLLNKIEGVEFIRIKEDFILEGAKQFSTSELEFIWRVAKSRASSAHPHYSITLVEVTHVKHPSEEL